MYRRTGIILVLLAVALSVWLLVTPVRHFTGYLVGGGEIEKLFTTCGKTIGILSGHFEAQVTTPGARNDCVKEARGRVVYVVIVAAPLLLLGGAGIARGRYPNQPMPDITGE